MHSSTISEFKCVAIFAYLCTAGDFVTPLKKRRVARESLSIDDSMPGITEEEDSVPVTQPLSSDSLPIKARRSTIDGAGSDLSLDAQDDIWSQVINPFFIIEFKKYFYI